jgi:speckle-type POZ protein
MKEAQDGVIKITDFDHEVLTEMIRYMYSDQVPKLKEMAVGLMLAAHKYDLPGLVEICKDYLRAHISIENLMDVLIYANELEIEDLEKAAIEFMIRKNDEVFESDEWKEFEQNNSRIAWKIMKLCIKIKG